MIVFLFVFQAIEAMEDDDSKKLQNLKNLISDRKRYLAQDIAFINNNYNFLIHVIKRLEATDIPLKETFHLLTSVQNSLKEVKCPIGVEISNRLNNILRKNPDLDILRALNASLVSNTEENAFDFTGRITFENNKYYNNSPLVSVDVERCFSQHKSILRENRRCFKFQNLKKYFFIYCNK